MYVFKSRSLYAFLFKFIKNTQVFIVSTGTQMVPIWQIGDHLMITQIIHSWTCRPQIYLWEQTIEKNIPISGIKNYRTYFNIDVMKTAVRCLLLDNVRLMYYDVECSKPLSCARNNCLHSFLSLMKTAGLSIILCLCNTMVISCAKSIC